MFNKVVSVPPAFQELHGEKTRIVSLVIVYITGILAALVLTLYMLPVELALWQYFLGGIIILDIAGGVVANLTTSTNQYYQRHKTLQLPFLALHILQPLGLYLVFPQHMSFFIYLFIYTFSVALVINTIKDIEYQQNLAASFLVIGILSSIFFQVNYAILYMIAALYMAKLILGFSVKRPTFVDLH